VVPGEAEFGLDPERTIPPGFSIEGMGHCIPGERVPPYPDPGRDTTVSGLKVDGEAMFRWVLTGE